MIRPVFGLHRIRVGMVVIGVLWLAVAACMAGLWAQDKTAGMLFVPCLGWVSVACALNVSILRRNSRHVTA